MAGGREAPNIFGVTRRKITWLTATLVLAAFVVLMALRPREMESHDLQANAAYDARNPVEAPLADGSPGGRSISRSEIARTPIAAHGIVLDRARDLAIRGAMLRVTRDEESVAETVSDEDGKFTVPCIDGDVVEVHARGYLSHRASLRCADSLRYLLSPAVWIEGRVLEPDGSGAAEARVACTEGIQTRPEAETTADHEGLFSLTCGSGSLRLSAHHASGAPAWQEIGERAPGTTVEGIVLKLGAGRMLAGTVRRADGTAAAAEIIFHESGHRKNPTLLATGDAGRFRARISEKEHTVAAVDEHGRTVRTVVAAGSADPEPLVLVLPDWLTMRGRLVGDATDATVYAHRDRSTMRRDEPAAVREEFGILLTRGSYFRKALVTGNRFSFEGIEPGTYSLRARSRTATGNVTASTSSGGEIVIVMNPSADLDLTIRWDDGRDAEGRVRVSGEESQRHTPLRDGKARLTGLAVGPHEIAFVPDDGVVPQPTVVPLVAGENSFTWTVSGEALRIEGVVLDADTARPIPGVRISTPLEDWYGWSNHGPFVLTDENGRFVVAVANVDSPIFFFHEGHVSRVLPASRASLVRLERGTAAEQVRAPDFEDRWKKAQERSAARGNR